VGRRLVVEAAEPRVKRGVAEVALKRQVDAMLLEMAEQSLAAVKDQRALPAFSDPVHIVVVPLRVHLPQCTDVKRWRKTDKLLHTDLPSVL